jgi:hypothetical protein
MNIGLLASYPTAMLTLAVRADAIGGFAWWAALGCALIALAIGAYRAGRHYNHD